MGRSNCGWGYGLLSWRADKYMGGKEDMFTGLGCWPTFLANSWAKDGLAREWQGRMKGWRASLI